MGVDVINLIHALHRHFHTTDSAFTRWSNHVVAIGSRAVTDDFTVNFCAARQSVFQLFNHHHAAAARDHETITIGIVSARRFFWCFVVFGG
ncbi:Uncharacterised protein [Vibrio cholerae]|uniref:Uncharacterized protein n=1 Tax=Vibrio cholerae TaxID=666 RepID=A0A655NUY4_VIBCL|nr:Uncharacterised protein [Vibrio cholerae]